MYVLRNVGIECIVVILCLLTYIVMQVCNVMTFCYINPTKNISCIYIIIIFNIILYYKIFNIHNLTHLKTVIY